MRERARFGGTAEQEVLQAKAEMERRLEAAAERERAALEKQRVELTGTAEEKLEYARREQQERRIEQLHRMAARRMANQGILRGWTAWRDQWYEHARQKRLLLHATARLSKPHLVAAFKWLLVEAEAIKRHKLVGGLEQKILMVQAAGEQMIRQERYAAAEQRLHLQKVIRDLEAQIRAIGREPVITITPEPVVIVLYNIAAKGIPDADAVGGADPYVRFICLDHEGQKKESAYTSYKYKELNPSWDGERPQLMLTPGGARPPRVRIEIWDKDQQTPDDMLAAAEVTLENITTGTVTIPLKAADPGDDDVEAFTFAYEFQAPGRVSEERPDRPTRPWPGRPCALPDKLARLLCASPRSTAPASHGRWSRRRSKRSSRTRHCSSRRDPASPTRPLVRRPQMLAN